MIKMDHKKKEVEERIEKINMLIESGYSTIL